MVIYNAKDREQVPLSKMFDRLESHLRSIESLGVTNEQTTEFLYPMLESCLPEDILIAWQRSANYYKDGSLADPSMTEMDYLLQFLRSEVQSEEQRILARANFTDFPEKGKLRDKDKKFKRKEKLYASSPTSYGLVAGQMSGCLFCDKNHALR